MLFKLSFIFQGFFYCTVFLKTWILYFTTNSSVILYDMVVQFQSMNVFFADGNTSTTWICFYTVLVWMWKQNNSSQVDVKPVIDQLLFKITCSCYWPIKWLLSVIIAGGDLSPKICGLPADDVSRQPECMPRSKHGGLFHGWTLLLCCCLYLQVEDGLSKNLECVLT